jgi:hypothetical protein
MYLPVDGKISIKYAISLPNYDTTSADNLGNGIDIKGNAYQYSIFTLNLGNTVVDSGGAATDKMVAFGVQNVAAAVDSFFGKSGLYTGLQTIHLVS